MKIANAAAASVLLRPSFAADVDPRRGARAKRHLRGLEADHPQVAGGAGDLSDLGGAGGLDRSNIGGLDPSALAAMGDPDLSALAAMGDQDLSALAALGGQDPAALADLAALGQGPATAGPDPYALDAIDDGGSASPGGSATNETPSGDLEGLLAPGIDCIPAGLDPFIVAMVLEQPPPFGCVEAGAMTADPCCEGTLCDEASGKCLAAGGEDFLTELQAGDDVPEGHVSIDFTPAHQDVPFRYVVTDGCTGEEHGAIVMPPHDTVPRQFRTSKPLYDTPFVKVSTEGVAAYEIRDGNYTLAQDDGNMEDLQLGEELYCYLVIVFALDALATQFDVEASDLPGLGYSPADLADLLRDQDVEVDADTVAHVLDLLAAEAAQAAAEGGAQAAEGGAHAAPPSPMDFGNCVRAHADSDPSGCGAELQAIQGMIGLARATGEAEAADALEALYAVAQQYTMEYAEKATAEDPQALLATVNAFGNELGAIEEMLDGLVADLVSGN